MGEIRRSKGVDRIGRAMESWQNRKERGGLVVVVQ